MFDRVRRKTTCVGIAVCLLTGALAHSASAQTLTGLRIDGPDQIVENGTSFYRVFAQFDTGMEFDVTLSAFLSVMPGTYASIGLFGDLHALEVTGNQVEMIDALFFFNGVIATDQKDVTILDVPAAGHALDFDGLDDYVRIPRSTSLEPTDELTIEAWIRPDSAGSFHNRIVRIANNFGDGYILAGSQGGDARLQLRIDLGGGGIVVAKDSVSLGSYAGSWHHVAGVYSATGNFCRLYVDGQLVDGVPGGGAMSYSNSDLYIGNYVASGNEDFDGNIDEVRIWSIARTAQDIRRTMHRPLTGNEPGLVGYWRFDEGSGQAVIDSSPNGNDGVLGFNPDPAGDPLDPIWLISDAPIFAGPVQSVDVFGLSEVAENWQAGYTAVVNFADGSVDGTLLVDWSIAPTEAGTFDEFGNLSTGDLAKCADLPATVSADYTDPLGMATGQQAVTIVRTGGAGATLDFDGQGDVVAIPTSPDLNPDREFTLEVWIHPHSRGDAYARIIDHMNSTVAGFNLLFQFNNNRRMEFQVNNGSSGLVPVSDTTDIDVYLGDWHHVAAVYSVAGDFARLYVDGVLKNEIQSIGPLQFTQADIFVGSFQTRSFDGLIDDVRIWNIARTEADIRSTMFTRLAGDEPGLVGYWRIDEGSGQTVTDLTEFQNHGTLGSNPSAPDPSDPAWVASDAPIGPAPPISGDASLDGLTNGDDIAWFIGLVFAGPFGAPTRIAQADFDCNGLVDEADIAPFVSALLNP